MFKEVVNPLKKEVEIRDELAKRLQKEVDALKKDLKLLNACLRLPKMCDQFQKATRRKETQEKNKLFE